MAKQKFTHFVPRAKPRKRPGRHKKRLNKHEKYLTTSLKKNRKDKI
jgi:hypothetical protein